MAQKFIIGADRAAQESNFSTILSITSHGGNDIAEMELRSVQRFDTLKVGGVLYVPAADTEHLKVEKIMEEKGIPYVLLYRRRQSDTSPTVVVDHALGFRLGLEHLISLGHRHIGVIYHSRYKGPELLIARKVFKHYFPKLSWERWSASLEWDKIRALLHRRVTGFITLSDDIAFALEALLKEHDFHVPRDVSIIGFRDTIVARTMTPKLTTIHVPAEDMGYAAAKWLIRKIEATNPKAPEGILEPEPIDLCMPPSLVVRESTASPSPSRRKLD